LVADGVADGVAVGVPVAVAVGVKVAVAVGGAVEVAVGVDTGIAVMVGVGVALCAMQLGQGSQPLISATLASNNKAGRLLFRVIAQPAKAGPSTQCAYCFVALPETTWKQSVPAKSMWLTPFEKAKELFPTFVVHCAGEPEAGVKTTLTRFPVPSAFTVYVPLSVPEHIVPAALKVCVPVSPPLPSPTSVPSIAIASDTEFHPEQLGVGPVGGGVKITVPDTPNPQVPLKLAVLYGVDCAKAVPMRQKKPMASANESINRFFIDFDGLGPCQHCLAIL
jgi:hypothetical protein